MEELSRIFQTNDKRLTTVRTQVFQALETLDRPCSLSEIIDACSGIDRVSIYRTLRLYEELSIINIIHVGWKKLYELAGPFKPHHHHLVCTSCHAAAPIESSQLEQTIHAIGEASHFAITSHAFEIRGLCASCQHPSKQKTSR